MGFWRYLDCHVRFSKPYSSRFRVEKRQAEAVLFRNGSRPLFPHVHSGKVLAYIQLFRILVSLMCMVGADWTTQWSQLHEEMGSVRKVHFKWLFSCFKPDLLVNWLINLFVYFAAITKQPLAAGFLKSCFFNRPFSKFLYTSSSKPVLVPVLSYENEILFICKLSRHFPMKVVHQVSLRWRGLGELGNGLLWPGLTRSRPPR